VTDHTHRVRYLAPRTAMAVAVNDYLGAISVKGYTHSTVVTRSQHLGWLVAWLEDRGVTHPGEVTKPVLERYQRSLFHHRKADGRPLSFRTQYHYLMSTKGLFRWLARTNRILFNPASELELPRFEARLPATVLNVEEVEAVLAQPDITTPLGLRDRAVMEVFYSTGIRRSELIFLSVHDLDAGGGTLTVRQGKGRRDRVVPIGERAVAWVDRYLVEVRPRLVVPPDDHVLFLNGEGNPVKPNQLSDTVRRYIRQATGRTGSCHVFRHSMATLMLEGGADIRHVQEMLGHASLENTRIYTRVTIGHLKAVHDACHPGATNTRHRSPNHPSLGHPSLRHAGPDRDDVIGEVEELLTELNLEAEQEDHALAVGGRSATGDTAALHNHPPVEDNHHDQTQPPSRVAGSRRG
jgi:integrase/recombinase XerD